MRVSLLILFALSITQAAQAEFCNWGFAGPKVFRCEGKSYVYGTAACNSGIYKDIFCQDELSNDGRACADDNAPATIDCYNKMVAPKKTKPKSDEFCNWGFAGPKVITCSGQKFVYGTAACPSGIYSNIFCKEEFSYSGKACSDDDSAITIQCYNAFMKSRQPVNYNNGNGGSRTNSAGTAQ